MCFPPPLSYNRIKRKEKYAFYPCFHQKQVEKIKYFLKDALPMHLLPDSLWTCGFKLLFSFFLWKKSTINLLMAIKQFSNSGFVKRAKTQTSA